jgi:hypothetical protein
MPKPPKISKVPGIKPIRPVKPVNKLQNLKSLPKIGQSEAVEGHWRFDTRTNKYVWVKAHWRKP